MVTHLDLGGAEEVAITLAERLTGPHDFAFFAVLGQADTAVGRAMRARLDALGAPLYTGSALPLKAGGLPQAALRLAALLRRERFDVVHLHTEIPETAFALARTLGPGLGRPGVLRSVHNATLWPSRIWARVGRWVEGRLTGAHAVAVSGASLAGLQAFRAGQGLPPARGEVVHNGVGAPPPSGEARPPGPPRLLFAARLERQKGADLLPALLERAAGLAQGSAEVTLLGDGSLAPELRAWAAGGRSPWRVALEPPRPNLSAQLANFDAVLMPSRFEGFGLLAAEALLAGTPVVAFDVPGLNEVLSEGYPLLAPAGDLDAFAGRLAALVAAPERHRDLVRPWAEVIRQRFSPERMAAGYGQVYTALASGRAGQEVRGEGARGT